MLKLLRLFSIHDTYPETSQDLSEVVKLDEQNTQHALHLGGFSDVWLGWLENESSTPMKVGALPLNAISGD